MRKLIKQLIEHINSPSANIDEVSIMLTEYESKSEKNLWNLCPFCESEKIKFMKSLGQMYCLECGAAGPMAKSYDVALMRWNGDFNKEDLSRFGAKK